MGNPMCRWCMRSYHRQNPFHRIEQWNGSFFRPGELWEVGTHLLVRHLTGVPLCETLIAQEQFLERLEEAKDKAEQEGLNKQIPTPAPVSETMPPPGPDMDIDDDIYLPRAEGVDDDNGDVQFMQYLQELREQTDTDHISLDAWELEDEIEEEETETPIVNRYLPADIDTDRGQGAIMGTYVRIVHTNGIHNIAMISCQCRGHDTLSSDLLAAHLLPTSFKRIRTLFTAQLLDLFRLCNLELKASVYQFHHLLQRLTSPMAPSEVVNLYREFRRMSRIWRWMKRLKWAGHRKGEQTAGQTADQTGQLAIICPACPQPGINIPENWKDDTARQVY